MMFLESLLKLEKNSLIGALLEEERDIVGIKIELINHVKWLITNSTTRYVARESTPGLQGGFHGWRGGLPRYVPCFINLQFLLLMYFLVFK